MKLATIAYDAGEGELADALLRDLAHRLRDRGLKLAGAVQWNAPQPGGSRCDMELEDLATGRRFSTAVDKAPGAPSCRLDASALEDVAGFVASSISPALDLVIVNRFGKQEIAGNGFRAVIEAAVVNELPVLTAVNRTYSGDWAAFAGAECAQLDADPSALETWCRAVLPDKGIGKAGNDGAA